MLHLQDHTRHAIIRRQISTLLEAGLEVIVVDAGPQPARTSRYEHLTVAPTTFRFLRTWIWRIVRPLARGPLAEWYWTALVLTEHFVTVTRCVLAARSQRVDVYQAHDLWALLAAVVLGRLRRRPVIYDAHELDADQGSHRTRYLDFLRAMEKRLIPRVDRVIVPSESRAKVYRSEYRPRAEPVVVLNCAPRMNIVKGTRLRDRLRLPAATKIVLYHGAMMPDRSLDELIRSAAHYRPGVVLVMVGEQNGYFREVLRPIAQEFRVAGRVLFLPYVEPQLALEYAAEADLGVVIYKNVNRNNYLCAPTKLYEFIGLGIPVIACNFPEIVALFAEYRIGTLFDPDDSRSIASAVNNFFQKDSVARDDTQQNLQSARHRFVWEHEGPKVVQMMRSIV